MERSINLKNIIYSSLKENDKIILSIISVFTAYWLQDIVFPDVFSKFTTNVPEFIQNLSMSNVFGLLFPYLVAELLFYINNIIVADAIPNIELNIVKKITDETFESLKTSKQQINVNEYTMNLKKIIESKAIYYLVISYIVPTILVGLGMIYYFMRADLKMGLLSCLIMAIFMYITITFQQNTIKSSYENEDEINLFYDSIHDVVSNYDTVITSNTKDNEMIDLNNKKQLVKYKYTGSELKSTQSTFNLHLMSLATAVILNGFSFKLYIDGKLNKESLVTTAVTSILFMQYYNSTIVKFKNTIGHIGKFYEVSDYFDKFKIRENQSNDIFSMGKGNITFKNISLKYEDKLILDNFSYDVTGGNKIGIVGKVGSGKTSLLKMIAGLLDYDGNVYIDGQNIKKYDYNSIMEYVAYIPQHPKMFNNTIFYNITYGVNCDMAQLISFLQSINFLNFFEMGFKNGFDTQVGKEGTKLSGGQKQIIAILRALLKNKKILLLDEPTSSLDPETKKMVISLLNNIKNKTLLIVSHDQDINKIFDKVITFKKI
jgi:ABC-type multidrug transport system fused ATPase/permease subunit